MEVLDMKYGNPNPWNEPTHLQHLNIRHAQVEIRCITEDETTREKKSNRENGAKKHVFADWNIFGAVEEVSSALEDASADCLWDA